MKRIRLLSFLLTLCVLAGLLLSCKTGGEEARALGAQSGPAKKFAKALTENQYADAVSVWNEKIAGDTALETEATQCITAYLTELESGALSGEYSAADVAIRRTTIEKVCSALNAYPDGYNALGGKIDAALSSKAAYQSGCSLEQTGHYADALKEYAKVILEDPDYADAQSRSTAVSEKLREQALSEAEQALQKDDIKGAKAALENAQEVLGEDAELTAKLKTVEKDYVQKIKTEAAEAFTDYSAYEQALALVNAALAVYPQQQELEAEKEYYKSFAPTRLCSLKEYSNTNVEVEATYEDAKGTEHADVIGITSMFINSGKGEVVYVLDGKYNTLTFTVFGVDVNYSYETAVSVRDYSTGDYDTSEILYRDEALNCAALPFEVTVDVSGVELLRVYVELGSAVSDATLQRTEK